MSPFPVLPPQEKKVGSDTVVLFIKIHARSVTPLSRLDFLVKAHLVSALLRKRVRCDPAQLIARAWQLLLISAPSWVESSPKQEKNLCHVAKWVFEVAPPALARWCDPSAFWDVRALLTPGASGSQGCSLAGCEKPLGRNFYPGYRWILEEMTVCFSGVASMKNCILMVLGISLCLWPFMSADDFLVQQ